MMSSSWPISPNASTWSSCLPAGKLKSSERSAEPHEAPCRQIETFKGHAATNGLRSYRLISAGWERLSPHIGFALALPPVEERSDTCFDLPLLLRPHCWLPKGHQVAKGINPDV